MRTDEEFKEDENEEEKDKNPMPKSPPIK